MVNIKLTDFTIRYNPYFNHIEVVIMDGTKSYEFEFEPELTIDILLSLSERYKEYLDEKVKR